MADDIIAVKPEIAAKARIDAARREEAGHGPR